MMSTEIQGILDDVSWHVRGIAMSIRVDSLVEENTHLFGMMGFPCWHVDWRGSYRLSRLVRRQDDAVAT